MTNLTKSARKITASLFLVGSCILSSCSNDDESILDQATLDEELTAAIEGADLAGVNAFVLPEDGDFDALPQDPRNPITNEKVALGKMLFHETALGVEAVRAEGLMTYSCGSCHNVSAAMQPGRRQGIAEGGLGFGQIGDGRSKNDNYPDSEVDAQPIRAPSTLNVTYQKNVLWNGMFGATGLNTGTEANWTGDASVNLLGFEGAESQAIKGLEVHRLNADQVMMEDMGYMDMLRAAFPGVEDDTLATRVYMGLAIATYVRTITTSQAPFQEWLRGNFNALNNAQKRGAILFFDKANCVACHTGPGLNKMEFSAVGMDDLLGPDIINPDPVNTPLGRASFTGNADDNFKFKIPQLYNLKDAPFLGHGSSFTSLEEVVEYFNEAIPQKSLNPGDLDDRFQPLGLNDQEVDDLVSFLRDGLYDANLARHIPDDILSNNCFPNADEASKIDLGCN